MSHPFHDRLDLKLSSLAFTDATCGSLNNSTGVAEYCSFGCASLKAKLDAGEDPNVASNADTAPPPVPPFDPSREGRQ